jgi:hypothetical protein
VELNIMKVIDPLKFAKSFWPTVTFYRQQQEIIYSVMHNDETYVQAGNSLGKDFVAGFIALWWFLSRRPARVVTTSVKVDQLEDVLWGEIRRFIQTAKGPLPIKENHLKLRQVTGKGKVVPNAELVGQVSNTQEGLLGRHSTSGFLPVQNDVPRTLVIFDEASGVDDQTYQSTQTWAHRKLIIGNPFPCDNFFKRGCKGGDIPRAVKKGEKPGSRGYHRKVIKIKAVDSPNIQYALAQIERGMEPDNHIWYPGVKSWEKYQQDLILWDDILKCVGLDAEFYEGPNVLLFPPDWLNAAEQRARDITGWDRSRWADTRAMGIDPGEGGADTSWTIVDCLGILYRLDMKTPDTDVIPNETVHLMDKYGVPPERVVFDRGGGGYEHACTLRARGYNVQTVGFGETVTPDLHTGTRFLDEKIEHSEERYAYRSRRAQMYGQLRDLIDPSMNKDNTGRSTVFAIPDQYHELRRQLAPIPLLRDREGRLILPPKNKAPGEQHLRIKTLTDLIGRSPDHADSLVLAVHGMLHAPYEVEIGAIR